MTRPRLRSLCFGCAVRRMTWAYRAAQVSLCFAAMSGAVVHADMESGYKTLPHEAITIALPTFVISLGGVIVATWTFAWFYHTLMGKIDRLEKRLGRKRPSRDDGKSD